MRRVAVVAAIACACAALPDFAAAQASDAAYNTIRRLGAAMDRCWFQSGDPAFAGYAYSPEPNASTGPRILIVPKQSPDARPALVVELHTSGGRININAFGPLATSAAASRIGADLRRWLGGGEGCK